MRLWISGGDTTKKYDKTITYALIWDTVGIFREDIFTEWIMGYRWDFMWGYKNLMGPNGIQWGFNETMEYSGDTTNNNG